MSYNVAVCQCSDTAPLESLAVMLKAAGYQAHTLDRSLVNVLKRLDCDTVSTIEQTMSREGVERPFALPVANVSLMDRADLYVDVKAHRNGPKVWQQWPRLKTKTLWFRINGSQPEHVIRADGADQGDEINPCCPILTPNLWYRRPPNEQIVRAMNASARVQPVQLPDATYDRAYACWPPFHREGEYYPKHGRPDNCTEYADPVCFVHNLTGWGFGHHADGMSNLGVKMYGRGSPDGLMDHAKIPGVLSRALAMVHLKTHDAPGYALYEGLSAACPLIVSARLIEKNLMHELFEDGKTCLVYDHFEPGKVHWSHTPEDVQANVKQVAEHLQRLRDVKENKRIGMAGRKRLLSLMWSEKSGGDSLRAWMTRMFG